MFLQLVFLIALLQFGKVQNQCGNPRLDCVVDKINALKGDVQEEVRDEAKKAKEFLASNQNTSRDKILDVLRNKTTKEDFDQKVNEMLQAVSNSVDNGSQHILDYMALVQAELQSIHDEMQSIVQNVSQSLVSYLEEANQNNTKHLLDALNPLHPMGSAQNPAPSCKTINQGSPSGNYYIQSNSAPATLQYCDMTRTCCNTTGGWMQVANIDMTDPNQQCPSGFRNVISPRRSCGRPNSVRECVSTTFPVHSVEYSKVCGRVIGYQFGNPNAFTPYGYGRRTIDESYVDGIVLTYGSAPRNHIWTFACIRDDVATEAVNNCPCSRPDLDYTLIVPSFVGENYFCETGSRSHNDDSRFHYEDPLWDGQGCTKGTCCNHPLYFCAQLSQPTRDDIELRLCGDEYSSIADTPFELVEIYIQ